MGGENDGARTKSKGREQPYHLVRALNVHVGEGFVEQQKIGRAEKRAGQRGALTHALRVLSEGARERGVKP